MQKITPHLWFDKEAKAAAEFYTSVFDNSKINFINMLENFYLFLSQWCTAVTIDTTATQADRQITTKFPGDQVEANECFPDFKHSN